MPSLLLYIGRLLRFLGDGIRGILDWLWVAIALSLLILDVSEVDHNRRQNEEEIA